MKKLLALVLALAMMLSLCVVSASAESDLKIGLIMVGDDTEGYTLAHMEGIRQATLRMKGDEK